MRHRVEGRKLKRTASHRSALLRSLATQLFLHKRIRTTEAKAKEARRFAEAIIARARRAYLSEQGGGSLDVHARRVVARDINDTEVVRQLFSEIAPKVATRNGGYTRVVKLGTRLGDGARIAILELVDYNIERDENAARLRTRRTISRAERVARSRERQAELAAAKVTDAPSPVQDPATETVVPSSIVTEEPSAESPDEAPRESADDEPSDKESA